MSENPNKEVPTCWLGICLKPFCSDCLAGTVNETENAFRMLWNIQTLQCWKDKPADTCRPMYGLASHIQ